MTGSADGGDRQVITDESQLKTLDHDDEAEGAPPDETPEPKDIDDAGDLEEGDAA